MSTMPRQLCRWLDEKSVACILGGCAAVVILWLSINGLRTRHDLDPEKIFSIHPQRSERNGAVTIKVGETSVKDLLAGLASVTGCEIRVEQEFLERRITIAATVQEANAELIKAILEINNLRVLQDHGPGKKRILCVERVYDSTP